MTWSWIAFIIGLLAGAFVWTPVGYVLRVLLVSAQERTCAIVDGLGRVLWLSVARADGWLDECPGEKVTGEQEATFD